MARLIDIHGHFLPRVDDGSRYLGETRELLHLAHDQGFRAVTATPHYAAGRNRKKAEEIRDIHQEVRQAARELDPTFEVYLGEELFWSDGLLEALEEGRALTLNGTAWVLVEFAQGISYGEICRAVRQLQLAGYVPLLAHVERYPCLREGRQGNELLRELNQLGACLQMNYTSLAGASGVRGLRRLREQAWCRRAVLEGQIQVLGTDMHRLDFRPPQVEEAVRWLGREGLLEKLGAENPEKILRGEKP